MNFIYSGHQAIVELLIKYGADIDAIKYGADIHGRSNNDETALIAAASEGNVSNSTKKNKNCVPRLKQIFIHLGYPRIVELLIRKGANVNARDTKNYTALIFAARFGNFYIENTIMNHNYCFEIIIHKSRSKGNSWYVNHEWCKRKCQKQSQWNTAHSGCSAW